MNWTDYIIIGVLALSVFVGLWRGLISEVMALAIWIAAFWVAWTFGPMVAERFRHLIELPSARIIVGYGLCFVAVLVLGALLRFVIGKLIESTGLSGTDRLLGMLFGFVRGVLLVSLLVFLLGLTGFSREDWWSQSILLPQFQGVVAWLGQNMPASVTEHMRHPEAMLDKVHPGEVLDKLHAADVLKHMPNLSAPQHVPTSGPTPTPARTSLPAAASSIANHFKTD
jgi:membrane protein required for colicin V production